MEQEHSGMKKESHCLEPPSTDITDSAKALREENEALKAAALAHADELEAELDARTRDWKPSTGLLQVGGPLNPDWVYMTNSASGK